MGCSDFAYPRPAKHFRKGKRLRATLWCESGSVGDAFEGRGGLTDRADRATLPLQPSASAQQSNRSFSSYSATTTSTPTAYKLRCQIVAIAGKKQKSFIYFLEIRPARTPALQATSPFNGTAGLLFRFYKHQKLARDTAALCSPSAEKNKPNMKSSAKQTVRKMKSIKRIPVSRVKCVWDH